jgi:hypothetical protein
VRATERNHSPAGQQHILAGRRIPAPAFPFGPDAKFSKSADENVFPIFELVLYQLQQKLHKFDGLVFGKTELLMDGIRNLRLGQGHVRRLLSFKSFRSSLRIQANLLKSFGFVKGSGNGSSHIPSGAEADFNSPEKCLRSRATLKTIILQEGGDKGIRPDHAKVCLWIRGRLRSKPLLRLYV